MFFDLNLTFSLSFLSYQVRESLPALEDFIRDLSDFENTAFLRCS